MEDEHGNRLVQIQVIHRHGARAPSYGLKFPSICGTTAYNTFYSFIANTPSDVEIYPPKKNFFDPSETASCYEGQLTPIGAAQMFALGARLRSRYSSILPDEYDPALVIVRSTCMARTVESAVACLSGMYPARGAHEAARPLQIDVRKRDKETMLGFKRTCNRLYEISKAAYDGFLIPTSLEDLAADILPPSVEGDSKRTRNRRSRNHIILGLRDIALAMKGNGCEPQKWEPQVAQLALSQIFQIYSRETWRLGLGRVSSETFY